MTITLRLSKLVLVGMVAIFALLVGVNNVVDYDSNFEFVQHVLSMDTTFQNNKLMWRAISAPAVHHLAYLVIIIMELVTGLLCAWGTFGLLGNINNSPEKFDAAKKPATIGLTIGLLLWFGGFTIIAAEWFVMWQSNVWNGQEPAFRFAVLLMLTLIFLHQKEPDRS